MSPSPPGLDDHQSDNAVDAIYIAGCQNNFTCYDTNVSGRNLATSLVIDTAIGLICYAGWCLWRGSFTVYHAREVLPGVRRRPPPLKLGGHWQLW